MWIPRVMRVWGVQASNQGLTQVKRDTHVTANPFRPVDFTQRTNDAAPRLYRPTDFPRRSEDPQQQITGALSLPDLTMEDPRLASADQESAGVRI
jgi:hypothetical protein